MSESSSKNNANALKYARDEHGLVQSHEYVFNEDGSINWREMIKPEFLYVNKGWFTSRGKEPPASIAGLKDRQLLIMLAGIKELAKLRGFSKVSYNLNSPEKDYIVAGCSIDWIPNYETSGEPVQFEDFANASKDNTDEFCHKFLETIACNRAFIRSVRNFLNIHIIGADEIDRSDQTPSQGSDPSTSPSNNLSALKPQAFLETQVKESGIENFDSFKEVLRQKWIDGSYRNEDAKNWDAYKDIPAKECRVLLKFFTNFSES